MAVPGKSLSEVVGRRSVPDRGSATWFRSPGRWATPTLAGVSERELTEPVELCVGRRLAPAARGWSRRPALTANLRGARGRKKRWDYWCVITPEVIATMVVADIDYAGLAGVWVLDRSTGRTAERTVIRPFGRGIELPDEVCTGTVAVDRGPLRLSIREGVDDTALRVDATSADGAPIVVEVDVAKPADHDSLNVVIPWSDRRYQFTSKQNTRPATGSVRVGGRTWTVGETEDFATQDLGRGIWPYRIDWNWAAASGRSTDGRLVGLQFGGKWTEGTGYTENAVCIDGRLRKISEELTWDYDWNRPLQPWRVTGGGVDATLTPTYDRHDRTDLLVLKMEVHQCFGTWSGTVVDAEGDEVRFDGIDGFAEEARNRW